VLIVEDQLTSDTGTYTTVDAGPDQEVLVGATVQLDGKATDVGIAHNPV
jgi:hypothetical protein